jgi:hypothetical protein
LIRRPWLLASALTVALGAAAPTWPMDALPLAFDELVDRAARIVHGTVRDVTSGRDADGIPASWITLDVAECLKGQAGGSLTIKQLGVHEPLADGTLLRLPGIPRYRAGEEIVVFLHEPSGRGFTSPVGLGQGVYRAEPAASGRAVRSALATGAAEDLPAFLERVRRRVER